MIQENQMKTMKVINKMMKKDGDDNLKLLTCNVQRNFDF